MAFVTVQRMPNGPATLIVLDGQTGRRRWHVDARGRLAELAVSAGTVYVTLPQLGVVAFDAATGKVRWQVLPGGAQGAWALPAAGTVFVGYGNYEGYLRALDAQTGLTRWTFRPKDQSPRNSSWAALSTSPATTTTCMPWTPRPGRSAGRSTWRKAVSRTRRSSGDSPPGRPLPRPSPPCPRGYLLAGLRGGAIFRPPPPLATATSPWSAISL